MTPRASDAALLRAARRDPEAFSAFYREHADWIDRWFRSQLGEAEAAADLTAETFAQALLSLHRFRGRESGEGTAWLFGIARNLLRRYFARRRAESEARERLGMPIRTYAPDECDAVDARLAALALRDEIEAALGSLRPELRATLELRAVEELGYEEIARRTDTTEANARMRLSRALRAAGARMTSPKKESR